MSINRYVSSAEFSLVLWIGMYTRTRAGNDGMGAPSFPPVLTLGVFKLKIVHCFRRRTRTCAPDTTPTRLTLQNKIIADVVLRSVLLPSAPGYTQQPGLPRRTNKPLGLGLEKRRCLHLP